MTNHTWTEDDVQKLVHEVDMLVNDNPHFRPGWPVHTGRLESALAPFQPDPDAELVLKARIILDGDAPGFRDEWADPRIRAIIAAVREHDRRKG